MNALRSALVGWGLILLSGLGVNDAHGLSYTELRTLIKKRKITSIARLLPRLPKDFRTRYALLYGSPSPQKGSALDPRTLLFGKDGRLILTFNGSSKQDGFLKLEISEWIGRENRLELHEIVFPAPRTHRPKVKFSKANPGECLECHQQDPRPIWDEYNHWTDAYGGVHDETLYVDSDEYRNFESFLARAGRHPRYKSLMRPSHPGEMFRLIPEQKVAPGPNFSPNKKLTFLLVRMNARRVFRMLKASPDYARYAPLMAQALVGCSLADVDQEKIKLSYAEIKAEHEKRFPKRSTAAYWKRVGMEEAEYMFWRRDAVLPLIELMGTDDGLDWWMGYGTYRQRRKAGSYGFLYMDGANNQVDFVFKLMLEDFALKNAGLRPEFYQEPEQPGLGKYLFTDEEKSVMDELGTPFEFSLLKDKAILCRQLEGFTAGN